MLYYSRCLQFSNITSVSPWVHRKNNVSQISSLPNNIHLLLVQSFSRCSSVPGIENINDLRTI